MFKNKKPRSYWELLLESLDGDVLLGVVFITNWSTYDGMLIVETSNPTNNLKTEIIYNTVNFRSFLIQPMED